jgi:hypothetical protein
LTAPPHCCRAARIAAKLALARSSPRTVRSLLHIRLQTQAEEDRTMRRRGRGGLLGTAARTAVIAGTATAVSGKVARQQDAAHRAAGGESAAAGGARDRITQLERLDQLRTSGALTEDEFKREKAKLG